MSLVPKRREAPMYDQDANDAEYIESFLAFRRAEHERKLRAEHPFTSLFSCSASACMKQQDAAFRILSFGVSENCPDTGILDELGRIWTFNYLNKMEECKRFPIAYEPESDGLRNAELIWEEARRCDGFEEQVKAALAGVPSNDLLA